MKVLGLALVLAPFVVALAFAVRHDGWRALIPPAVILGLAGSFLLGLYLLQ